MVVTLIPYYGTTDIRRICHRRVSVTARGNEGKAMYRDDADRWRKSLRDPPTPEKDQGRSSTGTAFEDACRQGITNQEVIPSLDQQACY